MTYLRAREEEINANSQRQCDGDHMAPVRGAKPENERYPQNYPSNGAARHHRWLFQSFDFVFKYYLVITKMDSNRTYCRANQFVD